MKFSPETLRSKPGAAFAFFLFLLAGFEGLSLVGYFDVAGVATYCYGQTGPGAVVGKKYPKELCDRLLSESGMEAWEAADRRVTRDMEPWQWVAFADFIYNFGEGAFANSTLLRKFNAGDTIGACNELSKWNKAFDPRKGVKVVVKGLVNRRRAEWLLCTGYAFDEFYSPNHRPQVTR